MGKNRLLSLDVFRGVTIAAMILVNNPGSWSYIYMPLSHSDWHGCTPTDLIFPFFLFIMGVAVSISQPKVGADKSRILIKIIKRASYLFLIGLLLNGFPYYDLNSLRIMGVLQRIALVFLVIAIFHHYVSFRIQVNVGIGLLLFYWGIMMYMPVPGVGSANLEPTTNFSAWIDAWFLKGHMWRISKVWDPEGLFSTLPSIVTGLLGMLTGKILFGNIDKQKALIELFILANVLIVFALFWDMHFPINKSLWTSSFVLYTGGIAIHVFSVLFWLLDVKKVGERWIYPFQVFGSNAIVVFTLSGVVATLIGIIKIHDVSIKGHIYQALLSIVGNPYDSSLLFAMFFVLLCYWPVWRMYKNEIFIKI